MTRRPTRWPGTSWCPRPMPSLLDEVGFTEQQVRLQVYLHHLSSTADVVEWMKGTTLTRFK